MGDTYMQKLKKALDAGFSQGEAMFLADVLKPAVLTFDRDCFLNWRIMVSLWGALLNFEPVMYERVFGFCFEELLGKLSHLPMPSRAALLVCVKFGFCRSSRTDVKLGRRPSAQDIRKKKRNLPLKGSSTSFETSLVALTVPLHAIEVRMVLCAYT